MLFDGPHFSRILVPMMGAIIVGNYLPGPFVIVNHLREIQYAHFLQITLPCLLEDVFLMFIRACGFGMMVFLPTFQCQVCNWLNNNFQDTWISHESQIF